MTLLLIHWWKAPPYHWKIWNRTWWGSSNDCIVVVFVVKVIQKSWWRVRWSITATSSIRPKTPWLHHCLWSSLKTVRIGVLLLPELHFMTDQQSSNSGTLPLRNQQLQGKTFKKIFNIPKIWKRYFMNNKELNEGENQQSRITSMYNEDYYLWLFAKIQDSFVHLLIV